MRHSLASVVVWLKRFPLGVNWAKFFADVPGTVRELSRKRRSHGIALRVRALVIWFAMVCYLGRLLVGALGGGSSWGLFVRALRGDSSWGLSTGSKSEGHMCTSSAPFALSLSKDRIPGTDLSSRLRRCSTWKKSRFLLRHRLICIAALKNSDRS